MTNLHKTYKNIEVTFGQKLLKSVAKSCRNCTLYAVGLTQAAASRDSNMEKAYGSKQLLSQDLNCCLLLKSVDNIQLFHACL